MHRETAPADLLGIRPEIGGPLASVIQRCIEKEPGKRYQTARDLRAALEAIG
jgi:hypothetical protein